MVYLQLTQPYRNFDKVKIGYASINDSDNPEETPAKINFRYQIFRLVGNDISVLFERSLHIINPEDVDEIGNKKYPNLNLYDTVCRALLEYIVSHSIETGTLEILQ